MFLAALLILQPLAQATPVEPWGSLIQFGVVGLFLIAFVTGSLHSSKEVKELRNDNQNLRIERDEALADARNLRDTLINNAVPAMALMTQKASELSELIIREGR